MPLPRHQRQLDNLLVGFVGKGAVLARDDSSTRLRPRRDICAAPWAMGGLRIPDVGAQLQALQAKVAVRLLQPERHPWKLLMRASFAGYGGLLPSSLHPWGLGAAVLVSTFQFLRGELSGRAHGYVAAFRQLKPHRIVPVDGLSAPQVLCEPLFHNPSVRGSDGATLMGAPWEAVARSGFTRVGHLRSAVLGTARHLGSPALAVLAQRASRCR